MNGDKQIEEMHNDVKYIYRRFLEDDDCDYIDEYIAVRLYEKGYRKASDVAREIFAVSIKIAKEIADNSKVLADLEEHPIKRIEAKGEQIGALMVCEHLIELQKKYLGEDINVTTKESEGEG